SPHTRPRRSGEVALGACSRTRGPAMTRAGRSAASLLGVAAIEAEGLLISQDGAYVRYLEVSAVNPLALEQVECERVSAAFAGVAARLPDGESLQLYVQARTLALEELLADESHRCEQAAGVAQDAGEAAQAQAVR